MKMSLEHYSEIKQVFVRQSDRIAKHKIFLQSAENPHKPKDLEMRLRWDALNSFFGNKFICDTLYKSGLNNDHIDTALKKIMKDIF